MLLSSFKNSRTAAANTIKSGSDKALSKLLIINVNARKNKVICGGCFAPKHCKPDILYWHVDADREAGLRLADHLPGPRLRNNTLGITNLCRKGQNLS